MCCIAAEVKSRTTTDYVWSFLLGFRVCVTDMAIRNHWSNMPSKSWSSRFPARRTIARKLEALYHPKDLVDWTRLLAGLILQHWRCGSETSSSWCHDVPHRADINISKRQLLRDKLYILPSDSRIAAIRTTNLIRHCLENEWWRTDRQTMHELSQAVGIVPSTSRMVKYARWLRRSNHQALQLGFHLLAWSVMAKELCMFTCVELACHSCSAPWLMRSSTVHVAQRGTEPYQV